MWSSHQPVQYLTNVYTLSLNLPILRERLSINVLASDTAIGGQGSSARAGRREERGGEGGEEGRGER